MGRPEGGEGCALLTAYAGLAVMRPMVHRAMRRPVRRPVKRTVRGPMAGPVRRAVRPMRRVMRLGVPGAMMRLMVRPLVVMRRAMGAVRGPVVRGAGFRLFHENDGRSGHGHSRESGETEEKGTTADLLRLGSGIHRDS